ncbi:hypothetical protein [Clostridium ljungdahlii]|uniref:SMODS-associated and fused to various effectors domain-containing protein n=1 Tax=Clostridium ljungdahlii TaxID=1538 RepID=A0A162KNS0_9CLOT|nr:hypothetical protein [Clostridium ljungdahlii]OAA84802.1 hypothetical protein WY13_02705 [Clostridium ljungdahlii]
MMDWGNVNKLSCIITIVTAAISFVAGIKLHKLKKWIEYRKILKNPSKNAGVLIVSIGKNDIENQVKFWLSQRKYYKDISSEYIFKLEKIGDISSIDIGNIINNLRNKKIKLQQKGICKIHLFIAAPVSISTMIGAELSNDFNVLVYQYNVNSEKKYEFWGQLQR